MSWAGSVTGGDADPLSKVAGGLSLLLGLGFGIPGVIETFRFAEYGSVWKLMELPTYGNGPVIDIGIATSIPLRPPRQLFRPRGWGMPRFLRAQSFLP